MKYPDSQSVALKSLQRMIMYLKKNNVCYPIRIFVKRELHPVKKRKTCRWRIISSVSLQDQCYDWELFQDIADKMSEQHRHLPTLVGWSYPYGGMEYLYERTPELVMATDKSSWDWTMQGWVLEMFITLFAILCTDREYAKTWEQIVRRRFRAVYRATFVTSSGHKFHQNDYGLQNLLTLLMNSVAQVFLHVLAMLRHGMS